MDSVALIIQKHQDQMIEYGLENISQGLECVHGCTLFYMLFYTVINNQRQPDMSVPIICSIGFIGYVLPKLKTRYVRKKLRWSRPKLVEALLVNSLYFQ